jgi:progressive ankylosis protein
MRAAMTAQPTLSTRGIVLFWLPLAATWFMMALEGPYIAAIVARMPEAARGLAAFGVATSLAWLIESPIMMLLSASAALVRDRASYLALRRFANMLNALVTLGMAILALPPVFTFVAERLMGLPHDIARHAHIATAAMIFWPAAIGYRRFYQGILVRHHLTRLVAYGTVVRLVTMSVTAAVLAFVWHLPGALVGALALLAGVICEAFASRWMARPIVRSIVESDVTAEGTLLGQRDIARFYFPLALTSILSMALGPLVTFGLAHGRFPIESLAVWPIVNSMLFIFRSGGVAFQEVGIALGNHPAVRRTAVFLGALASLALALVALTPLETVWFERFSGLPHDLATFAVWPVRILLLFPALEYILSLQRARWIIEHRTRIVSIATSVEAVTLAGTLIVALGPVGLSGAVGGAIAMLAGRVAASAYLFACDRVRAADETGTRHATG